MVAASNVKVVAPSLEPEVALSFNNYLFVRFFCYRAKRPTCSYHSMLLPLIHFENQ